MNYENSWTKPGENFFKEAVSSNLKPDNPNAKVGDAANRKTQYSHIYVNGLKPAQAAELTKDFGKIVDTKWLKKDVWGTVGKNRKDVVLSGRSIKITNSKLGHLGGSQPDIAMVQKQIVRWVEANGGGNVKIGSLLHSQR